MKKLIKTVVLATSLAAACGVAAAKDTSPLAKVYPIRDMQYAYTTKAPGDAQAEAFRYESDKLARATEVLGSNLPMQLKRSAIDDLVGIQRDEATRALAGAYKQVQALHNSAVEAYVADAIWRHAAQMQFKSRDANALMNQLGGSSYARVRLVGRAAGADAASYAKRNSD